MTIEKESDRHRDTNTRPAFRVASGRFLPVSAVVALLAFILSCSTVPSERVFRHGAIVSSDRIASEVGLEILKKGGNAVDAACATALALAVAFPEDGNLGGGGLALIYLADSQKVFYLDFRETAPLKVTVDTYLDSAGGVDQEKLLHQPSAAATPGTVAGLYEMHRRFGRLLWKELVQPARQLADTGFFVGEYLAASLSKEKERLARYTATAKILLPGGRPPAAGERLYQPDLGMTLMALEAHGPLAFYRGETAQRIADYCADSGGFITMEDLAAYAPLWREPIRFNFRGLEIYSAGLPSSGGIVIGQILGMLAPFELERFTAGSAEYLHLFIEAERRAFADRGEYLGDPAFTDDLTSALLQEDYILSRHKSIAVDRASSSVDILPGMPKERHEPDQTTHLAVSDSSGNVVSLTYTLNLSYGCGAMVPGTGILLNNEMDDFSFVPGVGNIYGLVGSKANSPAGGKRMLSSMAPTIVFESGRPFLALGSPGGSKIISAVAQTIVNRQVYRMPLAEAVQAGRFHHQWLPDKVYLERGRFDIGVIQKLTAMGHKVEERDPFGEVMALEFSQGGTFITAVVDRRGPGYAAGY